MSERGPSDWIGAQVRIKAGIDAGCTGTLVQWASPSWYYLQPDPRDGESWYPERILVRAEEIELIRPGAAVAQPQDCPPWDESPQDRAESAAIAPLKARVFAILEDFDAPQPLIDHVLEETLYQLRVLLLREGSATLPGIGTLRRNSDGTVHFDTHGKLLPAGGDDGC